MPQRSIRFPDELHDAIEAEAERRGRPHTFSSVLVEWASIGRAASAVYADPVAAAAGWAADAATHERVLESVSGATARQDALAAPASTRTPKSAEPEPDLMKALAASLAPDLPLPDPLAVRSRQGARPRHAAQSRSGR